MTKVVDIYALPISVKYLADYRRMSRAAGRIFRKHGATEYREFAAQARGSSRHDGEPLRDDRRRLTPIL